MNGYLAIILDEASQRLLLEKTPPLHPQVFAHHVTIAFKPSMEVYKLYEPYLGTSTHMRVVGHAEDAQGQAVVVRVVGLDMLQDARHHITISTNNVPPFYSKGLVERGVQEYAEPFMLTGVVRWVAHEARPL